MIIPPKLKKGDTIGIVSTARKISLVELKPALSIIESWGVQIKLGSNLFEEDNQFSGTSLQRTSDLQCMIDNDSVKAILCARGGYGTVQIIDQIDFSKLLKNPKWIIGYSDVTVLHSHLNTLGVATMHATMPINFLTNTKQALESLKKTLFGNTSILEYDTHPFNKLGIAEGEIVGGNVSILYSLLGSNSDINTDGKILFIEDLDEYLYHIDRMMINLKRNGKFERLRAMIVGGMNNMNDNDIPFGKSAEQIILEHTKEFDFPICFGFPAGHLNDNRAILLGVKSKVEIGAKKVIFSNNFQQ
jgi:muramoyltetrapeptide carboxypeptidase